MKRLFIAAALLLLTTGLCIGSLLMLDHHIDRLLRELDSVQTAFVHGGADAAAEPARRFAAHFPEETRWFPLFLMHEHLDEAEDSALALPELVTGEPAAFEAELARCRRRLERLKESEQITWENLL